MKTLLSLASLMAATLFATDWVGAQEVRYDLTGTYSNTTPTTSLTAPGGAFDFQFLVPASVANSVRPSDPFFITAPILSGSYTFGGNTDAVSSGTYFFANSGGNQTDINLTTSVGGIDLFAGRGAGNVPLPLAARPDASGQSHFITGDLGTSFFNTIDFTPPQGTPFTVQGVTVSIVGASVPEPSSIGLMAVGLLSCAGVAFLRHKRVGYTVCQKSFPKSVPNGAATRGPVFGRGR